MRAAIHLHLFYPDIALELIARVAALGRADIDLLATFAGDLPPEVDRALDRVPGRVVRRPVENVGWDIAPLLGLVPLIAEEGYEAVCHLHTKRGDSGYAAEWRALGLAGTIADEALVARLLAAFADDPALMLAGPAPLYKSAAGHQFRNAELLARLAPRLMAPLYPPADWGFFAGTFFWARPALLERMAALADFDGHDAERDGTLAHALERLFGLAPLATGGHVGLVRDGALEIVPAPGAPDHTPIVRTLVAEAERQVAPVDDALAALIAETNPLVDYLRRGRDADALDPNPYFSSGWYNRIHEDVAAAGMHPLVHYANHGAAEGRSTGPLFDGAYYRRAYPDVTGDPLRHFLETGAAEGRVAIPVAQAPAAEDGPRRFYRHFDGAGEAAFLRAMAELPAEDAAAAAATTVSIIMPVYNRAAAIPQAIRSVLAQTHAVWQLLIVDDGSTDDTRAAIEPFLADPRIRLIAAPHGGVSAARNLGLAQATGSHIAYLDSDNRWSAWFLEVMTRFLRAERVDIAYSAIALRDDLGHLAGYRGHAFDWAACAEENYVDLNALVHARALTDTLGGFDPRLRRMVDWDLVLRLGRDRRVGYAPFVGVDYHDGKDDAARVTVREPAAFHALVRHKHATGLAIGDPAFAASLRLSFAIKIAAPEGERAVWGDWHFAEALAAEIRALGHTAHVDCREGWGGRRLQDEDVGIALRGLLPYRPRAGQIAYLWNISHPDQVPYEEYDRFTRVYCASPAHAALLAHVIRPPVAVLHQATDAARFRPDAAAPDAPDLLFCGNSRGVDRAIVRWAVEAGRPPVLYGGGWDGLIPPDLVAAPMIDNAALPPLYAGAGAVLNDHWPSMAAFGIVSNRLFDVVAAGGRAISDAVPGIAALFGDRVRVVDGPAALGQAADAALADRAAGDPGARAAADHVRAAHGFAARARRLVGDALRDLGLEPPFAEASVPAASAAPLRVHVIAAHGPFGPQSSALIRLVAPLTDPSVADRVALTLADAEAPVPPCDVCIVQRVGLPSVAAVDALTRTLGAAGAALVVDLDDAFDALDDHPEAERYRPLAAAIERAIAGAAESWFSTPTLAGHYHALAHRHAVIPNAIDPRLWRDWRAAAPVRFGEGPLRLLYMGTATHGADFALIRPALERLWQERPGAFHCTLIGIAPDVEGAPWLTRIGPPADAIAYPRFVRWLRAQGPFDVGLAPLVDTRFNRAKSDIKLLDYAALGMLPMVSDGPAYRADPAAAEVAMIVDDWHAALAAVLDDRDGARARAAAAQAYVWAKRGVAWIAPVLLARLRALR